MFPLLLLPFVTCLPGNVAEIDVRGTTPRDMLPLLEKWSKIIYPTEDGEIKIERAWQQLINGYVLKLFVSRRDQLREWIITHVQPWTGSKPTLTSIKDISDPVVAQWHNVEDDSQIQSLVQTVMAQLGISSTARVAIIQVRQKSDKLNYHVCVKVDGHITSVYFLKQSDGTVSMISIHRE